MNIPSVRLRRRTALSIPVVLGAAGLAACGGQAPKVPGPSGTQATGAGATPGAGQGPVLELAGERLAVQVGPLVRVSIDGVSGSVLPLTITRPAGGTEQIVPAATLMGGQIATQGWYRPIRLIDPDGSRVWVTTSTQTQFEALAPGGTQEVYATFGAVEASRITVFLPRCGLIETDVVDQDSADAPRLSLAQVVLDTAPDTALAEPQGLERFTQALDGASSSLTTPDQTSVDVASDVTFATDSAELNAQADSALTGVAEAIGGYSGGTLTITGHTDDVADDSYNQTLSEQRAQAVATRLAELVDLGAWTQSVQGVGETQPRVPNDSQDNRALNRRVEIVLAPTGGTDDEVVRGGGGQAPEPAGPVGKGTEPVTVAGVAGSGEVSIAVRSVRRAGGLLLGELTVTGGQGGSAVPLAAGWLNDPDTVLGNVRGESGGATSLFASDGLTLISGGDRIFPVDYLMPGAQAHRSLTELELTDVVAQGQSTTVCVVWPDTGESSLMIDHPQGATPGSPWRITDVPVS